MATCVEPDVRAKLEKDLVRNYHNQLVANGVDYKKYSWDRCWHDCEPSPTHHVGLAVPAMAAARGVVPRSLPSQFLGVVTIRRPNADVVGIHPAGGGCWGMGQTSQSADGNVRSPR